MSGLSWLIYLIGLSENVGRYFGWISAPLFLLAVGAIIFRLILLCNPADDETVKRLEDSHGKRLRNYSIALAFGFFASVVFYMLIPSKQTSVLIAASEVGQRVLQSEQAKAVGERVTNVIDPSLGLLQTWIKKETYGQQLQLDEMMKQSTDSKK